jgi:hypothetical protein
MTKVSLLVRAVAIAAAMVLAGQAHAAVSSKGVGSSQQLQGYSSASSTVRSPASNLYSIDVSGIASYDEYGSSANTVLTFNLGANAEVTGIGWDVGLTAYTPSWLSELKVAFEDSSQLSGVFLTPGVGETFSGTGSYSSGGILNLADYGLNFNVGADGILRIEFFEGYVDGLNPDGIWDSGTLTIQTAAVPEPATYGMMALGLLAVGGFARRRRS